MKKVLFLIVMTMAILFTSCKKDRVCTCITMDEKGKTHTQETTYTKSTVKAARSQCLSSKVVSETYGPYTVDCTLK